MRVAELFDTLELHNDLILDNEVSSKSFLESDAPILDGDGDLAFDPETPLAKFMGEDNFVNRLQQSRTQLTMNLNSQIDD